MFELYPAAVILAVAAVTALLRFLPFLLFGKKGTYPAFIRYLSAVLPYAVMGMLVVYCLRGVSFATAAGWLPQLLSAAVVVLLHLWKENTLLSIVAGTACHMLLMQLVFV